MKNFSILIIFVFIIFTHKAECKLTEFKPPMETIVLKLPNNSDKNWKEIARSVDKNKGVVEWIPCDQSRTDWLELICIQFLGKSVIGKNGKNFESALNLVRDQILSAHPRNAVTWRIIEKNQNDAIYEWILHKQYKDIPPQHEISHVFLTKSGFHRVGFTHKNSEIKPDQRTEWIEILKKLAFVVPFKDRAKSEGLSMAEKLQDSIDLGLTFSN